MARFQVHFRARPRSKVDPVGRFVGTEDGEGKKHADD